MVGQYAHAGLQLTKFFLRTPASGEGQYDSSTRNVRMYTYCFLCGSGIIGDHGSEVMWNRPPLTKSPP